MQSGHVISIKKKINASESPGNLFFVVISNEFCDRA